VDGQRHRQAYLGFGAIQAVDETTQLPDADIAGAQGCQWRPARLVQQRGDQPHHRGPRGRGIPRDCSRVGGDSGHFRGYRVEGRGVAVAA
jgi:hypothetical protein